MDADASMSSLPTFTESDELGRTWERAYYRSGKFFMKRSLRPDEYQTGERGLYIPRAATLKLQNEAASLNFLTNHTNIPVPKFYAEFEDNGAYCLVMEYIEGVPMTELRSEQKEVAMKEVESYITCLQSCKSNTPGGPTGCVVPPYRVTRKTSVDCWLLKSSTREEYVFCHNDLSQQNILVDPETLRIVAIIDWEFAGFYPSWFEMPLYKRPDGAPGSVAIRDEVDDTMRLLEFLHDNHQLARD